jgi:uncharacterized protein YbaP (TraB family)
LRLVRTALLSLALLAAGVAAAEAQLPTCTGKNVLAELEGSDPAVYAKILAQAAATENATAILWRIERAGRQPSHLFGTMHLTDDRITNVSPAVRAALGSARRLLLEVNADDLSAAGFMKAFASARPLLTFTDGRRLEQLLSKAEYDKTVGILERAGLPAQVAGAFRPWVASMMLALSECERLRVARGEAPLDLRLGREAQAKDIPVAGLETLQQQFRALASVPEPDQIALLRAGLALYDRIDDMLETTVQLYLKRQLGAVWPLQLALAQKVGVAAEAFDSTEASLIVERNLRMRDKALTALGEGGVMIAVGALHLPGRHGLVALLRAAGYTVMAVE